MIINNLTINDTHPIQHQEDFEAEQYFLPKMEKGEIKMVPFNTLINRFEITPCHAGLYNIKIIVSRVN